LSIPEEARRAPLALKRTLVTVDPWPPRVSLSEIRHCLLRLLILLSRRRKLCCGPRRLLGLAGGDNGGGDSPSTGEAGADSRGERLFFLRPKRQGEVGVGGGTGSSLRGLPGRVTVMVHTFTTKLLPQVASVYLFTVPPSAVKINEHLIGHGIPNCRRS